MQPYIHQTHGRIRIRSIAIKQQPQKIAELISKLEQAAGIRSVEHKRYAGSVTVFHDAEVVSQDTLLTLFESHGFLRDDLKDDLASRVVSNGGKLLGRTLLTMAAQRVLGPKAASFLNSF